jgi:hypothetical protein
VSKKLSRSTEAGKQALAELLRRGRNANLLTIVDVQAKLGEKGFQCTWSAIQELERPRQGQRLDWELINAIIVYLGYPQAPTGDRYTIRRLMLFAAELKDDNRSEPEPKFLCSPSIARRSTDTGKTKLANLFRARRGQHSLRFVHTQLQERGFQTSYYSVEKIQYGLSKIDWELVNALAELEFFPYKIEELMLIAAEVSSPTLPTQDSSNIATKEFTPHPKTSSHQAKIKSSLMKMREKNAVRQQRAYRLTVCDCVRLANHLALSATLQTGIVKIHGEALSRWIVETTGIRIALARKLERGDEEGMRIIREDLDAIARELYVVQYWHENMPVLDASRKYASFEDYLIDLQKDFVMNMMQ